MANHIHSRSHDDREDSRRTVEGSARRRIVRIGSVSLAAIVVCVSLLCGVPKVPAHEEEGTPAAATPTGAEVRPDLSSRAVVESLPSPPAIVELSRMHLAPGAFWEIVAPGPVLYAVESGALGVRVDGPAVLMRAARDGAPATEEPATPGIDYTLRPGDQVLALAETPQIVVNDGQEPTAFLSVVVYPQASAIPSWLPEAERPSGVDVQPLASAVTSATDGAPLGPVEIALVQVTLAPGEELTLPPADFSFLAVEAGTLVVSSDQGQGKSYVASEVVQLDPGTISIARNGSESPATLVTVGLAPSEHTH
jgi:quercetin dioxygenase-like cupin family protein